MIELSCPARSCASLSPGEVLERLQSTPQGLTSEEAKKRQKLVGTNHFPRAKKASLLERVLHQLISPFTLILLVVAVLTSLLGHPQDAIIIGVVLVFNTIVGLIQEGRASRALEVLEKKFTASCRVKRDGRILSIPSHDVTVGDIIVLKEGDLIPADGRWIESSGARVDESSLTGESVPVLKTHAAMPAGQVGTVADVQNAGFAQTLVVNGSGLLVVAAIGKDTEVGQIAAELHAQKTEPPLTIKIRKLSRQIAFVVGVFSALLFLFGIIFQHPIATLLATVMSLAVSIIPEGLPIVLTLVLSRGVLHMAEKNAVVKKLHAVEGLGRIQVICTDKTGTLTTNQLMIQQVVVGDEVYRVKGEGFNPEGAVYHGTRHLTPGQIPALDMLGLAARILGHDSLRQDEQQRWHPIGDPVEAAFLCFALRLGFQENTWKMIEEQPFSYTEKRRLGRWEKDGQQVAFAVGSPESIVSLCADKDALQSRITPILSSLAEKGLRVIAFATRDGAVSLGTSGVWTFVGMVGMGDPLRPEVQESVAWCREQGIRVVMITGDHPETAFAIAKQSGIVEDQSQVVNGPAFEAMSDEELRASLPSIRVFSRISPHHKLRIVRAYQSEGLLTAMTGDGVNDAPALQQADIGVAMGASGTDVAREAADLVLLDDNFSTIVTAVQEGRTILLNIRRVLSYLFSTSIAEALVISVAVLFRLPLPLLPGQIIWINLITDGFLDVSLAMEPRQKVHHRAVHELLDRHSITRMALLGVTMAIGTLIVYIKVLDHSAAYMQTMVLTTLAVYQWINAWSSRSETQSIVRISLFSNRALLAATTTVVLLQIAAVYTPFLQRLLHTTALDLKDWAMAIAVALSVLLVDELWKAATSRYRRDAH